MREFLNRHSTTKAIKKKSQVRNIDNHLHPLRRELPHKVSARVHEFFIDIRFCKEIAKALLESKAVLMLKVSIFHSLSPASLTHLDNLTCDTFVTSQHWPRTAIGLSKVNLQLCA